MLAVVASVQCLIGQTESTPTHYTCMPMIGELDGVKGYSRWQEK